MYTVLVVVQVLVAVALVSFVLLQHGKGADAGAAFGSGASGTVFGSRGSANFLSRTTAILAAAFFSISLALAYLVHGHSGGESVVDRVAVPAPDASAPAVPEPTPAAAKPQTPKVPDEAEPSPATPAAPGAPSPQPKP